jgi:membrane fusion protein (multidrug efflux system)
MRIFEAEVAAARAVVDQSEAEMKRALANLKHREAQLGRVQSLRKQKGVSQEAVDEAIHARDDAAAAVEAAKAAIHAAQQQVAIKAAQLQWLQHQLTAAPGGRDK